jgi:hypothetical protein
MTIPAVEKDCGRLEWAVLDWNEPSIEFYKSLGAKFLNEWIVNRVSGKALNELADQFLYSQKNSILA